MSLRMTVLVVLAVFVGIGLSYVVVHGTRSVMRGSSISELPATMAADLDANVQGEDKIDAFERQKVSIEAKLRPIAADPQASSAAAALWLSDRPTDGEAVPPVLRLLLKAPEGMEPNMVLHSPDINPRGLPIPDDVYGPMKEFLVAYHEHIMFMDQMKGAVRNEELEQLRMKGALLDRVGELAMAEAVEATVVRASQSLKDAGISEDRFRRRVVSMVKKSGPGVAGFVEYTHKGRKYFYPRSKLVVTASIAEYMRFRGDELAFALVAWASASGLITDYERKELLENMARTRR